MATKVKGHPYVYKTVLSSSLSDTEGLTFVAILTTLEPQLSGPVWPENI